MELTNTDTNKNVNQKTNNDLNSFNLRICKNKMIDHLRNELAHRCQRSPSYSLRSFAKYLEIGPSTLSKILNGKSNISQKMINKIVVRLMLTEEKMKELAKKSEPLETHFTPMSNEQFLLIKEWYYYPILELSKLSDFESSARWISKKLRVNINEVKLALSQLLKAGLLTEEKNGSYTFNDEPLTTIGTCEEISEYHKMQKQRLQKTILKKAKEAIDDTPYSMRSQTSLTIAMNNSDIDFVKLELSKFRRRIARQLKERSSKKNCVYNFSFSFYPLTILEKKRKELP